MRQYISALAGSLTPGPLPAPRLQVDATQVAQ